MKCTLQMLLIGLIMPVIVKSQNTWTQRADFGGGERSYAFGFSIGGKAYVGAGINTSNADLKDFWEYDPATDKWTKRADFGGEARDNASAFSINGKGYVAMGKSGDYPFVYYNDLWEYDPATDVWTKKADYPAIARTATAGFSIGDKGYIGGGFRYDTGPYTDFWEYDPATDTWSRKADFIGGGRSNPFGLSIGDKGYMGLGWNGGWYNDFYEYDPTADKWTRKADYGGSAREYTTGFSIGNKGYIGIGYPSALKDFWEYDPAANNWTKKADFGGVPRSGSVGFSINNKGYIGTGNNSSTLYKDFWEYTPDENTCVAPSSLTVSKITDTSAVLKWAASGVSSFKIRYRVVGSTELMKRNAKGDCNHIILCGLTPNTTYEWQIRSNCATDTSEWISGPNFTTVSLFANSSSVNNIYSFNNRLLVSPNPNNGNFVIHLSLPSLKENTIITLYSSEGKKVWQENPGNINGEVVKNIFLANKLPNGIYTLKIQRTDISLVQKVIVAK